MDAHGPPEFLVTLYASTDLVEWGEIGSGMHWVATSRGRGDREFYKMKAHHPTDD